MKCFLNCRTAKVVVRKEKSEASAPQKIITFMILTCTDALPMSHVSQSCEVIIIIISMIISFPISVSFVIVSYKLL